jgi:twitching motility protein PilT
VKLLDSLLDAIVRLEGDALVMHVGEKPYVITASASMNAYRGPLAWGQVELSSRVLTFDAVSSMLTEILPADQQRALDEFGAIEHEILPPNGVLDRFTVIAARGGEDVWVEVRRKPMPVPVQDAPAAPPPPDVANAVTTEAAAQEAAAPDDEASAMRTPEVPSATRETPATTVEPPSIETIAVALPGQETEHVTLAGVPDDAIQIVDDEQQGVPTEAEVDAMLAATASALLTSGLGADHVDDADIAAVADTVSLIDAPAEGDVDQAQGFEAALEDEADLAGDVELVFDYDSAAAPLDLRTPEIQTEVAPDMPLETARENADVAIEHPQDALPNESQPESPAFELVAPTERPVESSPEESDEISAGAAEALAPDAPLFSEDAIAAAAAIEPVREPEVLKPAAEPAHVAPVEDAALAQPDLSAHVAVWQEALSVWNTAPELSELSEFPDRLELPEIPESKKEEVVRAASEEISLEAVVAERLNTAIAPELPVDTPYAETRMETTPEPRSDDAVIGGAAPAAAKTHEPPVHAPAGHAEADDLTRPGVVVPLARSPIKPEPPLAPFRPSNDAALMHTLRVAAARGAATVYVVAQSKPMIRVDGEIIPLESEPTLTAADVDRLVMELAPPRRRDALQNGPAEWLCDVPEIGRVRCLTFRDHRGPGVLFRMFPPRAISADQLALTPEVQALCQQPDGLVLVTGARASGKSTLLNAFIDLINRTRSDHVITIESQIGFVHESRKSFISQRETRGDVDLAASVARAALREDPDVMMIEEVKSADVAAAALEAAESGRLVLASIPAASTIGALERLLELFPADRRARVRSSLATSLRGAIAQVLLRRVTGGRVAAREILLNTPAVSTLVLEGKMFQLPVALDSGRRHGMVPLTDSLAGFVRDGIVHPAEAYRKALDRAAFVAALKRDGVDTSFAERLA